MIHGPLAGGSVSGSSSSIRSISKRVSLPLDEVLYMPVGRVYVIRRGQQPMEAWRYNILESEAYRAAFSPEEKRRAEEPLERET